jgi:hypothetical protein
MSMDAANMAWVYTTDGIPRNITVLKSNVTVVHTDGTKSDLSNGICQHHTFVIAVSKSMPSEFNYESSRNMLDSLSSGSLFVGGSEGKYGVYFITQEGRIFSGYHNCPIEKLVMNGGLINCTNQTNIVYTLNEIEYILGKAPEMMDSSMYVLAPRQCESQ